MQIMPVLSNWYTQKIRAMCNIKKIFFTTVRIGILVYLGLGLVLFFNQRDMLYHPSDTMFGACPELEDAEAVTLSNGARGYFMSAPNATAIVVMYHGNAGSACDRASYASFFESRDYATFIAEYAGYGGDQRGSPNVTRILADAEAVAAFIDEQGFPHTVLFGRSLGASVAAYHATLFAPDMLILDNPVISTTKRAQELYPVYPVSLLLRERYDTRAWVSQRPEIAVAFIHAGADTLVPPHHSKELHETLPQRDKTLTIIEGATHNTLPSFPTYWDALTNALPQQENAQ